MENKMTLQELFSFMEIEFANDSLEKKRSILFHLTSTLNILCSQNNGEKNEDLLMRLLLSNLHTRDIYVQYMIQKCIVKLLMTSAKVDGFLSVLIENITSQSNLIIHQSILEILTKLMSKKCQSDVRSCCFRALYKHWNSIVKNMPQDTTELADNCLLRCSYLKLWTKIVRYVNDEYSINYVKRCNGRECKREEINFETNNSENSAKSVRECKRQVTNTENEYVPKPSIGHTFLSTHNTELTQNEDVRYDVLQGHDSKKLYSNAEDSELDSGHVKCTSLFYQYEIVLSAKSADNLINILTNKSLPFCAEKACKVLSHYLAYGNQIVLHKELSHSHVNVSLLLANRHCEILSTIAVLPVSGFCNTKGKDSKKLQRKFILLVLQATACLTKLEDASTHNALFLQVSTNLLQKINVNDLLELIAEEDDIMIETMLCLLDIWKVNESIPSSLNPHRLFISILQICNWDHTVLLDWLSSPETCFLIYINRYLAYLSSHWNEFILVCNEEKQIMENTNINDESSTEVDQEELSSSSEEDSTQIYLMKKDRLEENNDRESEMSKTKEENLNCTHTSVSNRTVFEQDNTLRVSKLLQKQECNKRKIDEVMFEPESFSSQQYNFDYSKLCDKARIHSMQNESDNEDSINQRSCSVSSYDNIEADESVKRHKNLSPVLLDTKESSRHDKYENEKDFDKCDRTGNESINCIDKSKENNLDYDEESNNDDHSDYSEEHDLAILKMLKDDVRNEASKPQVMDDVMSVLIKLKMAIDRLVSKNLFPFPVAGLQAKLETCETLYECCDDL